MKGFTLRNLFYLLNLIIQLLLAYYYLHYYSFFSPVNQKDHPGGWSFTSYYFFSASAKIPFITAFPFFLRWFKIIGKHAHSAISWEKISQDEILAVLAILLAESPLKLLLKLARKKPKTLIKSEFSAYTPSAGIEPTTSP